MRDYAGPITALNGNMEFQGCFLNGSEARTREQ